VRRTWRREEISWSSSPPKSREQLCRARNGQTSKRLSGNADVVANRRSRAKDLPMAENVYA
jgi:hypothetical protein